ncbi:putative F-box/LRR-repeat protein 23 [Salvia divinorum]|uniref:F-box/LRR-repeat protein 23 n=1 Tax=Salvia divinorum TaxID=28513 RepID=A0ABD1HHT3_SALDI
MIQTAVAASSSSSAAPTPPWIELPEDLTANILKRLDVEEILESAQKVCSTWWRVCKNPAMWRVIDFDSHRCASHNVRNIWLCAVDRSQGQLLELKLSGSRMDDLLAYAAERSSQLRCLTLDVYLIHTVLMSIKKLPQLEELHLIARSRFTLQDFETIVVSCPTLKSFTYEEFWNCNREFTDHAVAIGKTMPNLRHLRLFNLSIENKGLEAILDGCPGLESLHLQLCSGLDLQGGLGKRCSDRIKDLILDPVSSQSEHDSEPYQSERDQADYDWDEDDDLSYSRHDIDGYDPFSSFPGQFWFSDYDSDPDFH